MAPVPRSKEFDDVYFSAEDGLAETRHVFLQGNNLPAAWAGKEHFTIFETGFGTGLNFLAVWKLFEDSAKGDQTLRFVSVEKFPLGAGEIDAALSHWGELSAHRQRFIEAYSQHAKNKTLHNVIPAKAGISSHSNQIPEQVGDDDLFMCDFGRVSLEVHFGDANDVMPALEMDVDAWFLDGFKPSSNPEIWSETVFGAMGRMSHAGSSFATFTSAGFVRRGLQTAGFEVRKVPGYGRKREMSVGVYI